VGNAFLPTLHRSKDIEGKSFNEMAEILSNRLDTLKSEINNYDNSNWKIKFIEACETKHTELLPIWENDWIKLASGKRLIDDLYKEYKTIHLSKIDLKRKLIKRLKTDKSEDWTLVKAKIIDALKT